jgi:YVTN family beta-propeller protein
VNPTTNKIYVANHGSNNVTVIDGTTGSITSVADAQAISPAAVAVNSTTNKIYVINTGSNNVTVIDGATNAIATVAVGVSPIAIAVNPETNRIYVANNGDSSNPGSITVIDGATDSTTSLTDPNAIKPTAVAVYPLADEAYIANSGSNNVTVIASENFSLVPASAKITVQRGGQATDLLTIAGTNGPFGMSVKLTCTVTAGPSPLPSCTLSPNSVTPGTGSASSTLTISAAASAVQLSLQDRRQFGVPLYGLFLPLVFGTTLLSNSRRRPRSSAVLCGSLVGFLLLLGACGGPSATSQGAKNYTVTVSGASGAIQHTAQVAVTVQ